MKFFRIVRVALPQELQSVFLVLKTKKNIRISATGAVRIKIDDFPTVFPDGPKNLPDRLFVGEIHVEANHLLSSPRQAVTLAFERQPPTTDQLRRFGAESLHRAVRNA